jgi:hypothetical protein
MLKRPLNGWMIDVNDDGEESRNDSIILREDTE